jgi:hypothetical protein
MARNRYFPSAAYPDMRFIHTQQSITENLTATSSPLDLGRTELNPAEDRGTVDRETAVGHHSSQITVADAILAVPARVKQDDLNRKAAAFEQRQRGGSLINGSSFGGLG